LPGAPTAPPPEEREAAVAVAPPTISSSNAAGSSSTGTMTTSSSAKRSAAQAALGNDNHDDDDDGLTGELTEAQKIERRERNREHAKRSRLRKKFLLESLQEQIHGLEEQLDRFKQALRTEIPQKAEEIIKSVCGDKDKYTPLPMPSGFGPVKTLMEPDFRLSTWWIQFNVLMLSHCESIRLILLRCAVPNDSVCPFWFPTKLCHFGPDSTRQSHRLCQPGLFDPDWIFARSSAGAQLSISAGARNRSKCRGSYSSRDFRRRRHIRMFAQLSSRRNGTFCFDYFTPVLAKGFSNGLPNVLFLFCGSPFGTSFLWPHCAMRKTTWSTMSGFNVRYQRPSWRNTWESNTQNQKRCHSRGFRWLSVIIG
jgi:Basic region leucine zipper